MEYEAVVSTIAAAAKVQQTIRAVVLALDEDESDFKRTRQSFPRLNYDDSTWGRMLRDKQCHDPCHPDGAQFRRIFAVPYAMFSGLVHINKHSI